MTAMGCFNCDDTFYRIKDCPQKIDTLRASRRKMEYMVKKTGQKRNAHAVLFALCNQLDGEPKPEEDGSGHTSSESPPEPTDTDLLDTLLAGFVEDIEHLESPGESIHIVEKGFVIQVTSTENEKFQGACIGTGATRSMTGLQQAEAYYRALGTHPRIETCTARMFRFGGQRVPRLGLPIIVIPYARGYVMHLHLDVVDVRIPLLLGIDTIDIYRFCFNKVSDELVCIHPRWSAPVKRKLGYL